MAAKSNSQARVLTKATHNRDDSRKAGKALRDKVPRKSHAVWQASRRRRDPVDILLKSCQGRIPQLIPIRFGRMMQTPFAFYRGAAAIMAADLSATPASGIRVQACGDCHLMNFGAFATPERHIIFDMNDFDETLPAPWEWDVKRLATSFVIAGRHNKFREKDARASALRCVQSYREHMAEFSEMRTLDRRYERLDIDEFVERTEDAQVKKRLEKRISKARSRDVMDEDFPKLVSVKGKKPTIKDNPPLIYHRSDWKSPGFEKSIHKAFKKYRETLSDDRKSLLDHFEIKDIAAKVVGVGSVGRRCGILLLMADNDDALFLQVKEARTSVLEPYAGKSVYSNRGQRVVVGQRLMQSASDIFLGWTRGDDGGHYYVRQLWDGKIKPAVEIYDEDWMLRYADACGWVLARAHATSGDPAMISGYLGGSDTFDRAIADFAVAYANQNEADHAAFLKAIRDGRIEVYHEQ
jgi:uncharacterized protein (DUF2252 family)